MRFVIQFLFRLKVKTNVSLWIGALIICCLLVNTLSFYYIEKPLRPGLTLFDSLWLSLTTITTVGYGDLAASTFASRLVVMISIYLIGIPALAWLAAQGIDAIIDYKRRRRRGMVSLKIKDHILIVFWPAEQKVKAIIDQIRNDPKTALSPVVVITDRIKELPLDMGRDVYFVYGSPTEEETYHKANIKEGISAIVLAKNSEDPESDALTAAAVGIIERLNPEIETTAECILKKHISFFLNVRTDRIVHTADIATQLIVKASQNRGVASAVREALDSSQGSSIFSMDKTAGIEGLTFRAIATALLELKERIMLIAIVRKGETFLNPEGDFMLHEGDGLVYIGEKRFDWKAIEPSIKKIVQE